MSDAEGRAMPAKKKRTEWFRGCMGVVGDVQVAVTPIKDGARATPEQLDATLGLLRRARQRLDDVIKDVEKGIP